MKKQQINDWITILKSNDTNFSTMLKAIKYISDVEVLDGILKWAKTTENLFDYNETYLIYMELKASYNNGFSRPWNSDRCCKDGNKGYDWYYPIRMAIANNPHISERIKLNLARDKNIYVKAELCLRQDLNNDILEEMLKEIISSVDLSDVTNFDRNILGDVRVLVSDILLHDEFTNYDIFNVLPKLRDVFNKFYESARSVRDIKIASKFNLPGLEKCKDTTAAFIYREIKLLPKDVSSETLYKVYKSIKDSFRFGSLAFFDICEELFKSFGPKVPQNVYDEVLVKYVLESNDKKVLYMLMEYPYASIENMKRLCVFVQDEDYLNFIPRIRLLFANNNTSNELKEFIYDTLYNARKIDFIMRSDILPNMNFSGLSENIQYNIIHHSSSVSWKCLLIRNKTIPLEYLIKQSTSNNPLIQLALLDNPNCTKEIYENIRANSTSDYIRETAEEYIRNLESR